LAKAFGDLYPLCGFLHEAEFRPFGVATSETEAQVGIGPVEENPWQYFIAADFADHFPDIRTVPFNPTMH
jgi:hypothetical protein